MIKQLREVNIMSNAFLIMGLTRRVSQFNEDRKANVVSVATLDNLWYPITFDEFSFEVEDWYNGSIGY